MPADSTFRPVQVARMETYHVRIPLISKIKHASHSRQSSDNVIVRCQLSDGSVGYGEGVPREYVTGETIDQSLDMLRRVGDWFGGSVASMSDAVQVARNFAIPRPDGDDRQCVGNAARCAAELAYLDAAGRAFSQSLIELGMLLPECDKLYDRRIGCRYSGAITSKSDLKERVSAWKTRIFGFRHCKVKVGTEGQNDAKRLALFRRILGSRTDIRIDANEAWTPANVAAKIKELEPFKITSVEQPVSHEQIDCMAEVRKQIATPVMLDESLCSMIDAERAIAGQTCDLFNLRISKCGGLIPTMLLAAKAVDAGLGFQLGCQVGETGLLSAAGRHFACTIHPARYLEGSYDHYLVAQNVITEDITFGWFGKAPAITGPGLGVAVDEEKLAAVTIAKETLYG